MTDRREARGQRQKRWRDEKRGKKRGETRLLGEGEARNYDEDGWVENGNCGAAWYAGVESELPEAMTASSGCHRHG